MPKGDSIDQRVLTLYKKHGKVHVVASVTKLPAATVRAILESYGVPCDKKKPWQPKQPLERAEDWGYVRCRDKRREIEARLNFHGDNLVIPERPFNKLFDRRSLYE